MPVSFKEYFQLQVALHAGEIDEATIVDRFKAGAKKVMNKVSEKPDEDDSGDKKPVKRESSFDKKRAEWEARKAKRPNAPKGTESTFRSSERANAHDRTGEVFGFGKVNSSQELDLDGEQLSEAKQEFEVGYIRADNNSRGRTRISASNAKAARARFMKLHIGMRVVWVKPAPATPAQEPDDLDIEMDDAELDAQIESPRKGRR